MSSFSRILVSSGDSGDGVTRITLHRPEKRNAIDATLLEELGQALAEAKSAKVIVLTGAGKDFCSGADLSALREIRDAGPLENMDDARRMANLFRAMRAHPRPIVAAVRGRALAGGCGLATACDLVLAAESAQFGYPEVNIGFVPAMVMAILRRNVPEKLAFEWITLGQPVPAAEARAAGLINRVFPDESFEKDVMDFVASLAQKSMSALSLCKNVLYHMDGASFETALEMGVHGNGIARLTSDCRQGIEKFLTR
jgi:methylglutaconyl-CoA hydratase